MDIWFKDSRDIGAKERRSYGDEMSFKQGRTTGTDKGGLCTQNGFKGQQRYWCQRKQLYRGCSVVVWEQMVLKDGNSIGTEEGGNVNRHWNELKNASIMNCFRDGWGIGTKQFQEGGLYVYKIALKQGG